MEASQKIPLIYSGITIGLVIVVGVVFNLFFQRYSHSLYYKYLQKKAQIIAIEKFNRDELDSLRYRDIVNERRNTVATTNEVIINVNDWKKAKEELLQFMTEDNIQELQEENDVDFRKGNEVGAAILFNDDSGKYAVVVMSRNPYGEEVGRVFRWSLLTIVVVAIIVLYLISRLYAIRIVDRISNDYETERMFVNNASHEINNPLTAIQGECEIALMKERTGEEYRSSLEKIANETERVIRIMSNLLQFSHTSKEEIDPETLDDIDMAAFMQQFETANCKVHVNKNFHILSRADILAIAFRNIVCNAAKYSKGSTVTITVDKRKVTIEDHGIGIPAEDLPHIFDPFFRAKNSSTVQGQGVGLPLSKAIIDKFGAEIEVKSTEGKGTAFIVKFS